MFLDQLLPCVALEPAAGDPTGAGAEQRFDAGVGSVSASPWTGSQGLVAYQAASRTTLQLELPK